MKWFMEGTKVCLREPRRSDIKVWYRWFNDPQVTAYMNKGIFPNTELRQNEFYEHISKSKNDVQLAIITKRNGFLIGTIGVHSIDWVHRNGEVSIVIGDQSYWGRGVATEAITLIINHAFNKMNLNRIYAGVSSLNQGCIKAFKNTGFEVEGKKRKHLFYRGTYVDVIMLGLLKEEFLRQGLKK
jgi:[ribosomal protein S5]-alanine N-acetyltransferase